MQLVGQKNLLNKVQTLIQNDKFKPFCVLSGPKGSGKELVAKEISKLLNATFIYSGIKVDEVRDLIELAYSQIEPFVYYINKGDDMSLQAKNAILKVVEEPPKNAYFILATEDYENILHTLKSRAVTFNLDIYSPTELNQYMNEKSYNFDDKSLEVILNICDTPGDIEQLISYDVMKFYDFATNVLNNLGIVSGVNAFKISNRMKFKTDDEGFDINLFIKLCQYRSLELVKQDHTLSEKFMKFNQVCGDVKNKLKRTNNNKFMLFDSWLLKSKDALAC